MEIDQCDDFHDMMNYFSSIHFNFYSFYLKKKNMKSLGVAHDFFLTRKKILLVASVRVMS